MIVLSFPKSKNWNLWITNSVSSTVRCIKSSVEMEKEDIMTTAQSELNLLEPPQDV